MVEQQLNFEGLFETVLYARPRKNKDTKQMDYGFETKTDGTTPTKTPKGMFKDEFIPNDLLLVKSAIQIYEN
jgi:hypothetical protein